MAAFQVVNEATDVLVAGGGTAGAVAAIAAARAGARTCLIEKGSQLGGTMTTGGVSMPGYFHAWGEKVVSGIGWEIVAETKAFCSEEMPDFINTPVMGGVPRPGRYVYLNPHVYAILAEEKAVKAGVGLHYHETVTSVQAAETGYAVETIGKGLRRRITAKEIIDCTGDADLVGMLGYEREKADLRQPGTLEFKLCGYRIEDIDLEQAARMHQQAIQQGLMNEADINGVHTMNIDSDVGSFLRKFGHNQQHIPGADSSTSQTQTQADIEGRQCLLRILRFLHTVPGGERTSIQIMAPQTAIRETYRVVGETRITRKDYMEGRMFEDAIVWCPFFIDVHEDRAGVADYLEPGTKPTIPFGALIPKGSTSLLVAGRCLSSDRHANGGTREQPYCMAMGQAAGTAAALGVRKGMASKDLNIDELRSYLRKQGAAVPDPQKVAARQPSAVVG